MKNYNTKLNNFLSPTQEVVEIPLTMPPRVTMLGHTICRKDWSLEPRVLGEYELLVVTEGECFFTVDEQEILLKKKEYVLLPPGVKHSARLTQEKSGCQFYYVHFSAKSGSCWSTEDFCLQASAIRLSKASGENFYVISGRFFRSAALLKKGSIGEEYPEVTACFERAILERNRPFINTGTMLECYVSQVLCFLTRSTFKVLQMDCVWESRGELPAVIQEALEYIHENLSAGLTVQTLSSFLHISPQHLIRMFRKYVGTTPGQYINLLVVEKSKEYLRDTNRTIKEISYLLGVDNPHYFSYLFKKIEGIQPAEYRRIHDSLPNT